MPSLEILSLLAAEMTYLLNSHSLALKYENVMRAGKVIFHSGGR
jgi:hypothetical protein